MFFLDTSVFLQFFPKKKTGFLPKPPGFSKKGFEQVTINPHKTRNEAVQDPYVLHGFLEDGKKTGCAAKKTFFLQTYDFMGFWFSR